MEIKIELNENYIASLFEIFGYTSEKVLVWYNKLDDECHVEDLGSYEKVIAYSKDERPRFLDNEKIMFDDVKEMGINEVANRLFNEFLMMKLFN